MNRSMVNRMGRLETVIDLAADDPISTLARQLWPDEPVPAGGAFLKLWSAISDGSILSQFEFAGPE